MMQTQRTNLLPVDVITAMLFDNQVNIEKVRTMTGADDMPRVLRGLSMLSELTYLPVVK